MRICYCLGGCREHQGWQHLYQCLYLAFDICILFVIRRCLSSIFVCFAFVSMFVFVFIFVFLFVKRYCLSSVSSIQLTTALLSPIVFIQHNAICL